MNKKLLAILFSFLCVGAIVGQQANAATATRAKVTTKTKVIEKKKIIEKKTVAPKIGSGEMKKLSGDKERIGSGEMRKLGSGEQNRIGSGERLGSGNKADMKLELEPIRELIKKIDEILQKSRVQAIKDALSVAKKSLQSQMPASGAVTK